MRRQLRAGSIVCSWGVVGNPPDVVNMGIRVAESCILTPSDVSVAREGMAAATEPTAVADLNLADPSTIPGAGTMSDLRDRRCDVHRASWRGQRRKQIRNEESRRR